MEKLWIHKGAVLVFAENVSQGEAVWRASYITQGEQKRAQIDQMIRFSENNQCRMMSLVRHFGDSSDGASSCGACDFCAPAKCVAQRFRTATDIEREALYRVLSARRSFRTRSTGKLYADLYPDNEISRDNFEEILGAMARAELLCFADAVFEKDGKQIPYRTVCVTPAGRATNETTPRPVFKRKALKKSRKSKGTQTAAPRTQPGKPGKPAAVSGSERDRLEQALRTWRLAQAKRRRVPAFSEAELLAVQGIGSGCQEIRSTYLPPDCGFALISGQELIVVAVSRMIQGTIFKG